MGTRFNCDRQPHERLWAVLLASTYVICLAVGIYAAVDSHIVSEPGSLKGRGLVETRGRLLLTLVAETAAPGVDGIFVSHWLFLLVALVSSVLLGFLLLRLVARHPLALTRIGAVVLGIYSVVRGCRGMVAIADGNVAGGLGLMLTAAVMLLLLWFGRQRIQLAGKLLGVSARALKGSPALLLFVAVWTLATWLLAGVLLALAVVALSDGKIVTAAAGEPDPEGAWCEGMLNAGMLQEQRACWVPSWRHSWAAVMLGLEAVWVGAFSTQVLVFVTASVMGQWHQGGSGVGDCSSSGAVGSLEEGTGGDEVGAVMGGPAAGSNGSGWAASKARVEVSVTHALRPSCSLGSLALSAFPLASPTIFLAQSLVRAKPEVARHGWARGILLHTPARILRGQLISGSRVATVLMACSGDSFLGSAEAAASLVDWQRFAVLFFAVWFNSVTLHVFSQLLSVPYGFVLGLIFIAANGNPLAAATSGSLAAVLGLVLPLLLATIMGAVAMALLSMVLLNITLAVAVMWVADKQERMASGEAHYQPVSIPILAAMSVATAPGAPSEVDELLAPLMGLEAQHRESAQMEFGVVGRGPGGRDDAL